MVHIVFTPTIDNTDIENEAFRIRRIKPSEMDVTDNKCENGETKENKAKGKQAKIAKVVPESSEKVEQSSPVKLLHDDVPIRYNGHIKMLFPYPQNFQK